MDPKEEESYQESEYMETQGKPSVERLEILNRIESGEIEVNEAIKQLKGEKEPEEAIDILDKLEEGEIDVQEALQRLEDAGSASDFEGTSTITSFPSEDTDHTLKKWRDWWLVILASSLAIIALSGWLGTIGGWWWVCAGPGLLLGFVLLVIAFASRNAPWLHVRVDTGQQSWPRHIALSFPLPIRLASWGLKTWGPRIPALNDTAVDELILALEGNLSKDSPIYIEVEDDETTGERVQIFLG